MPKLMLVVSAELKNIVILQPEDGSDDEKINYYFKNEVCVSINVKEKATRNRINDNLNLYRKLGNMITCQGCERHGGISQNHCTEVDLMLFNCDGLLHVEYSFNEYHVDLTMREYTDVIDGVEVSILKLKAKFVPYWG
ncbi:hypothetical protein PVL29_002418 [Vitis rotundifolia]|uniref:Uncharacterized protein n=1 Tax=Vitis rotundifolia TaxID=103349 RepID=A0AA39E3U1_VITRO|nr:hypothetical protein PVL29_002418 [Vitis rotundifolia]